MSYADCNAAGGMTAYNRQQDPKRLAFQAARYKHVAKILEGKRRVLEVGCSDGWFSPIVAQHVGRLLAIDVDEEAIKIARAQASTIFPVEFFIGDVFDEGWPYMKIDAAFSLDVFEHIPAQRQFIKTMREIAPFVVIGTPSAESQVYASEISKREHVNCVTKSQLRTAVGEYFGHVIVLGMNDETLHTGFDGMCNYLLAIGCD